MSRMSVTMTNAFTLCWRRNQSQKSVEPELVAKFGMYALRDWHTEPGSRVDMGFILSQDHITVALRGFMSQEM